MAIWGPLTPWFTGRGRRLEPGETAIGITELAVLRDQVGKAKYPGLVFLIQFLSKFIPRHAHDAREVLAFLLAEIRQDNTYPFRHAQELFQELDRRRGIVNEAHAAVRASGPNVIQANIITKVKLPPDKVLYRAVGQLQECVVIGFDKDGQEFFASTCSDAGTVLFHLERAKHKLMTLVDDLTKKEPAP